MKLSNRAVDTTLEVEGVWVPWFEDATILVARHNNPRYIQRIGKLFEELRMQKGTNYKPTQEDLEMVARKAASECLLLGWNGVTDDDGSYISYTSELGFTLFNDPSHQDFYRLVLETAMNFELYRKRRAEQAAKN